MGTGTLALIAQIIGLMAQGAAALPALKLAFQTAESVVVEGRDPTPDELAAIQAQMDTVHASIQSDT